MSEQRQIEVIPGIYFGPRDTEFKTHIISILSRGNLKQKYLDILTKPENIEIYASAYTSELVDEINNYQTLEQKGDLSGNKFIVDYIYDRFPQLNCAEGVKVAARLRINYGSKNSFCKIADSLGCWKFITATNDLRQRKKKPLLEDVFEAFLGATETIINNEFRIGVGYACIYKILKSIFDDMKISLLYEDLYDSKTRLKELFDIYSDRLGPILYEDQKEDLLTVSFIYRLDGAKYQTRPDGSVNMGQIVGQYRKVLIGKGVAASKADSQQAAASDALKKLSSQGFVKYGPAIYSRFASGNEKKTTSEADVLKVCGNISNIDSLFQTRGKTKYQNKYVSTVLIKYCRQRDYDGIRICLNMGANPNILDSDGMSATDVLLIGPTRENLIKKVIKRFLKTEDKLLIHSGVKNTYLANYKEVNLSKSLDVIEDSSQHTQTTEDDFSE
jgi:dsRNA-specific ribonuclease